MDSFEREQTAADWQRLALHFEALSYYANVVAKELRKKDFDENSFEMYFEDFQDEKNSCVRFMEENDFFDFKL